MSQVKAKKMTMKPKIEFDSDEYNQYREHLKSRLGTDGLSLCVTHRIAYNHYWREKHKLDYNNKCEILLPKEWIPDDKFLEVMIENEFLKGKIQL